MKRDFKIFTKIFLALTLAVVGCEKPVPEPDVQDKPDVPEVPVGPGPDDSSVPELRQNTYRLETELHEFGSVAVSNFGEYLCVAATPEVGVESFDAIFEQEEYFYVAISPLLKGKLFDMMQEEQLYTVMSTLDGMFIETVAPGMTEEIASGQCIFDYVEGCAAVSLSIRLADGTYFEAMLSAEEPDLVVNENIFAIGGVEKPVRTAFHHVEDGTTALYLTPAGISYFDELDIVTYYAYIIVDSDKCHGKTLTVNDVIAVGYVDNFNEITVDSRETVILENGDAAISDLMKRGVYEREVTGLSPEQRFVVFACHTDATGAVVSDVETVVETTPVLENVSMEFEIEIDQITATSAMLFITPTADEDYVWLEFPEYVYQDMTMEQLQDFLLKNYKPFFSLHMNKGEMVHSFDDKLEPDTEYMIIVFGYDGGLTTPLFTEKFRTLEPNDPTYTTFEVSFGDMTPRSASVTFKPSDASVAYLAIVADEELLEKNGGANADGVKKLIDKQIKQSILVGDCDDRADFAESYAQRGEATGNFSLKPGMKHYACAVCVDKDGNYASEVAIFGFDAPAEDATDATVSASVLKFFDGDALYAYDSSFSDFAGWAVVRLSFTFGGSATDAVYTIYPVSVIEEEGAGDDEIRALLLDQELLGEYNFFAEPLTEVQLEWGCDYRLYALPFDSEENAGELFKLDIPALSKDMASPVVEY